MSSKHQLLLSTPNLQDLEFQAGMLLLGSIHILPGKPNALNVAQGQLEWVGLIDKTSACEQRVLAVYRSHMLQCWTYLTLHSQISPGAQCPHLQPLVDTCQVF